MTNMKMNYMYLMRIKHAKNNGGNHISIENQTMGYFLMTKTMMKKINHAVKAPKKRLGLKIHFLNLFLTTKIKAF